MKAIISYLGKQFLVSEGSVFEVLTHNLKKSDKIKIDKVGLIANGESIKIGKPEVAGTIVEAEVVEIGKGKKLRGIKFNAKKRYQRILGYRQVVAKIKVNKIKV
ncbi:MAG TPA: 50S ribosomal protein L21 [Patescibacteria group bacterium]|nr:50S ribosomal protein L21 [Patescibacteria group bacterium]